MHEHIYASGKPDQHQGMFRTSTATLGRKHFLQNCLNEHSSWIASLQNLSRFAAPPKTNERFWKMQRHVQSRKTVCMQKLRWRDAVQQRHQKGSIVLARRLPSQNRPPKSVQFNALCKCREKMCSKDEAATWVSYGNQIMKWNDKVKIAYS